MAIVEDPSVVATDLVSAVTSLSAGISDREVASTLLGSVMDLTGAKCGGVRLNGGTSSAWAQTNTSGERLERLQRHLDSQFGPGRSVRCSEASAGLRSLGGRDVPTSVLRASQSVDAGRRLEVLLVDSCRVDGFSIDDQSAVEALVAVAALAVSNHHQSVSHRRFEEWMSVIEDTATVLLSGVAPRAVLDGVLDRIAREALHSTGAEMAGVATPDPSGTSMLFRIAVGAESEFLSSQPFPEDQSLSGHVRRTGEVLLVADAMLDRRSYGPVSERIGLGPTAIGPLWLNRRAIGVVFVGNHRHGRELDPTLAIRAVTSADLAQHLQVAGTRRPNGVASSALTEASIDRLTEFADELDGWSQLMSLDEREINLLLMVAEGLTNREIADHLDLAEKTIRNTMTVLWARLGVRNRVQAAVLVARHVERLGRLGALRSDC